MARRTLPAVDQILIRCIEGNLFEGTPCWIVTRGLDPCGYGSITDDEGVRTSTHRVAYKHFIGPIPPGLELDHRCRVRACANPWHTEPVTHAVNMARMRRDHCKRGHNDWIMHVKSSRNGMERKCRTCAREHDQAYRARRRAARKLLA